MKLKDKINRKRAEINLAMANPFIINWGLMVSAIPMAAVGSSLTMVPVFLGMGAWVFWGAKEKGEMKFKMIGRMLPKYKNPLQNIFQKLLFFAYWGDNHWSALNENEYKFLREEFLKSNIGSNMIWAEKKEAMPNKQSGAWDVDFLFPLMLERIGEDGCREVLERIPLDLLFKSILDNNHKIFKYTSKLVNLREGNEKILTKKMKQSDYNRSWGIQRDIASYLLNKVSGDANSIWEDFVLKRAEFANDDQIIQQIEANKEKNRIGVKLNINKTTKKNKI